ncbi:VENN motif pre-toxin domain-containing protein [Rosenbergiella epipactidis]|uniref:VENN motif pre-toxin domain-containing protein n=1 Tax=Rosenbergiella epipactidis TaxID=1544694 RepID=UPI001FCFB2A0|nr:VENN motif pre-toxin domain-containing protein [Rosenbergiella epipactidis]
MNSGGDPAGQLIKNAATSLLAGAQGAGSAESVTHSAISQGTLVVRDLAEQSQSLASLSRDVEHAHQTLSPIFDKEKEQNRLREAQLISSIGAQVANIAETQGKLSATKTAQEKLAQLTPAQQEEIKAQWLEQHPGQQLDERKWVESVYQQFYQQAINDSGLGVGGSVQRAIQAATAAVQGLAGGEFGTALAGGAAPYIANFIGHSDLDTLGKQLAHATVNAALAAAQGKDPLAMAAGATSAELVGIIASQGFGLEANQLDEDKKQTVSALATLAAGLAAGLVGGDTESTLAGMQAGKVTVENNWLHVDEAERKKALEQKRDILKESLTPAEEKELAGIKQTDKDRDQAIKDACTQGNKGSLACGGLVNEAQSALAKYGDNVTYSLIYSDLYPQDEANIESILKGLDPDSITRDVVIKGIFDANGGKLSWSDVETRYDAMTISVEIVRALVGRKGKVPEKLEITGKIPHVNPNTTIATGQTVGAFEKSLASLPPRERVAIVKQAAPKAAAKHGMVKDNLLTKKNGGRDVYRGQDGNLYALDTQHGRFEVVSPKGKHLGEVDFAMQKIPNSIDKSGGHDLKVK